MQAKSHKIPLLAACGIGLIFCWLVGYGWYRTFNSWIGNEYIATFVGMIFAIIATILALAIAKEQADKNNRISITLSYFFILFLLSSLGTINTLYFNVSGVQISHNAVKNAIEVVGALKNRVPSLLPTPEFDTWVRKVSSAQEALSQEIDNPKLCGQGPEALKRISELQNLLPSFRTLAGSGCDKNEQLKIQYNEIISKQIQLSENYQKAQASLEAKKYINDTSTQLDAKLSELLADTKSVSDISKVKIELRDADKEFSKMKDRIEIISGKSLDKNLKIESDSLQSMGNVGEIFSFIGSRLNESSTFAYILIALFIDLTLILAFKAIIVDGDKSHKTNSSKYKENYI
jgi:hypothetical protein